MQTLCTLSALPENEGRGFVVEIDGEPTDVVVVRRGDRLFGYRNRCPHRGTTLDWLPDRFMDPEGRHLQCATHDARFEVETGRCVAGPCVGEHLRPVSLAVIDGQVVMVKY